RPHPHRTRPNTISLRSPQQVIAGHRRFTVDDLRDAISTLNLEAGSPWTTVFIATIKRDQLARQAMVAVDWVDHISGDTDWTRVEPEAPATWNDLATEVRTIPDQLGANRRVLVGGHMRQATGFLIGSELRRVLGYEVGVRQGDQLWTGEEHTVQYELIVEETAVEAGPDIAIIVNVAANAAADTVRWITGTGVPVSKIITITPAIGVGPKV
ncbi:MAG: SAVED domain-containing protein, partial [Actinophytocola sp.]|nr:SAVED domain-containing protein [Actinophytocola sp.]